MAFRAQYLADIGLAVNPSPAGVAACPPVFATVIKKVQLPWYRL
jgi:hypothetical protein